MATNIYLGLPPPNVVKWIKDNYKPDMTKVPLHFTANEDNSSVSLACWDEYNLYDFCDSWCKIDYSMDGKTWQAYIDPDSEDETLHRGKIINLNKGETVYFRATLGDVDGNPNLNGLTQYEDYGDENYFISKYHRFVMTGSIKASGNIQFLLENTGTKMDVPDWCYYGLFSDYSLNGNISLIQAPLLPATTLAYGCYYEMFYGCTALTQAPALPAETLANDCYYEMFKGCTALTQAPALPAETLTESCYSYMFSGCTALTQAPALPATSLAESCYYSMFEGCTSLTQAPALPAETLADYCYCEMFSGCTNIPEPKYKIPNLTFDEVASKIQVDYIFCSSGTYEVQCSDKILVASFDEINYEWIITEK